MRISDLKYMVFILPLMAVSGCGIYGCYVRPAVPEAETAYGDIATEDTASLAMMDWRAFFPDAKLQALIDTALARNTDLANAKLEVDEAEASLKAAKLAFLPSASFDPSATYNGSFSSELPAKASWQIDLFGSLRNAKRRKQALLEQSEAYRQAVQSELVSTVAADYYSLLALDAQLKIYEETEANWKQNVETMRALMDAGEYTAASLYQTEADYYGVCNSVIDIRQQIKQLENTLCRLLKQTPRSIARGTIGEWRSPELLDVGLPVRLLSCRPDVREAENGLAAAFYSKQNARSAFYPSITISGTLNFGEELSSVIGSLVQPLFQQGTLSANLKIAEAQRKAAGNTFTQTVIDAGTEVNDAFVSVKAAREKASYLEKQVDVLKLAVSSTEQLMMHGSTTYLEVLTAEETLLTAQINDVTNKLAEISGTISLYQALGGGAN